MGTGLHLSVGEFDRMVQCGEFQQRNRKIELIHGELREMNPAGPRHDDLVMYLTNWSATVLAHEAILVTSQTGLDLAELASRPEPDLLWVRKARYRARHPVAADVRLAIEVSDSSLPTDLREKSELYAMAGIVEYWIVDAITSRVHVHRNPENGRYTVQSIAERGDSIFPVVTPNAMLDIGALFDSDPLTDGPGQE